GRRIRYTTIKNRLNRASPNRIDRTAHSRVAHESRAAGKNLFIRRLDVGMSANDGRNFSIEKSTHGDLLARRLTMDIDNYVWCFLSHLCDGRFHGPEGIFQDWLHKRARLHINDTYLSFGSFKHNRSATGCTLWII